MSDTRSRHVRRSAALVVASVLLAVTSLASAQASPANRARAEMLFQDGRTLLAGGRLAEACPKLADSQSLDPAPGTLRLLAECYEKSGKSASAWVTYEEAGRLYRAAAKPERVDEMLASVERVKATLSHLVVTVPVEATTPGLEVRIDGQPLPRGAWGTPSPIDPGRHHVEATAPGKKPWTAETLVVGPRGSASVTLVPLIADTPVPAAPPAPVAPATPTGNSEEAGPRRALEPQEVPPAGVSIRRGAGLGLAGLGVAMGTLGVVLAVGQANEMGELVDAKPFDRAAYDDANTKRKIGFGLLGGGAVLAGVGVAVALSKPSTHAGATPPDRPRVGVWFSRGVWLRGAW